jgi:tRNA (guanosine-2'-O-)-methyltransferase
MTIKKKIFNSLLDRYGLSFIKTELSKYLTINRIEKIEKVLNKRIKSVQVAFESPVDIHNAMASFRTIEAFGLMKTYVIDAKFKKSKGKKTTQGAHQWLDISYYNNIEEFLKINKYLLVGASLNGLIPLEDLPVDKNICLIFGNEKSGLSLKAQKNCDHLYKIPIHGMSGSYNLSVSCAISLYEVLNRKRKNQLENQELNNSELEFEKAWYYFLSLGCDLSEKILKRVYK